MRKLIGGTLLGILGTFLVIYSIPLVLPILGLWGFLKLVCWTKGKHDYPVSSVAMGLPMSDVRCAVCKKIPEIFEQKKIEQEARDMLTSLQNTKKLLDDYFKTDDQRAIDKIIEDTKN